MFVSFSFFFLFFLSNQLLLSVYFFKCAPNVIFHTLWLYKRNIRRIGTKWEKLLTITNSLFQANKHFANRWSMKRKSELQPSSIWNFFTIFLNTRKFASFFIKIYFYLKVKGSEWNNYGCWNECVYRWITSFFLINWVCF